MYQMRRFQKREIGTDKYLQDFYLKSREILRDAANREA